MTAFAAFQPIATDDCFAIQWNASMSGNLTSAPKLGSDHSCTGGM